MHIENVLNNFTFEDNKEIKYIYRLVRENFFEGQAYGIEVERQDFLKDKLIYDNIFLMLITITINYENYLKSAA